MPVVTGLGRDTDADQECVLSPRADALNEKMEGLQAEHMAIISNLSTTTMWWLHCIL